MTEKTVFVCDEITSDMIALDESIAIDDLNGFVPSVITTDAEEYVEITREITVDPRKYRSPNYQPNPNIPSEPDPDEDVHDEISDATVQDEAIAFDAARAGSKANIGCNTTFANCQAKNPLLCPYHGARLIEADIQAGLAQSIPNAVVSVKANSKATQAKGKNFSISIKVPASQKAAAEKVLDDFLNQPGIKSQGMKDWDPTRNEWSDFYDIDLLQTTQAPQGGMANRAALNVSIVNAGQQQASSTPSQPVQPNPPPATSTTQTQPKQNTPPPSNQGVPQPQQLSTPPPNNIKVGSSTVQIATVSTPTPGFLDNMSSVKDDKKWIKEANAKKWLSAKNKAAVEGLVEDKQLLLDKYNALLDKKNNNQVSAAAEPVVNKIMEGLAVGIENKDNELTAIKEAISGKNIPKTFMPDGAGAKEIKDAMKKYGAKWECPMLDTYDAGVEKNLIAFKGILERWMNQNKGNNPKIATILDANGEIPQTKFNRMRVLFKESMAPYLKRAKYLTFGQEYTFSHLFSGKGYQMGSSCTNKMEANWNVPHSKAIKSKFKYNSASAIDLPAKELFSSTLSSDYATYSEVALEWNPEKSVITYGMTNWYSKFQSGNCAGLITSPEPTGMILDSSNPSTDPAANFLLDLMVSDKPIPVTQDIEVGWRMNGYSQNISHNETPCFTGGSQAGDGVNNFESLKAIHFRGDNTLNNVISQYPDFKTQVAQFGTKIYVNGKETSI